jgi:hypothetical protein
MTSSKNQRVLHGFPEKKRAFREHLSDFQEQPTAAAVCPA